MSNASRIAMVGTIVTLLSLSGCVWDRGMRGVHARDDRADRRSESHRTDRDRNGQPCDEHRQGSDRDHDDDCRPARP
jgi:hypothetical protein